MKKSIFTLLPILLLLVSCATPQANSNTQVPPTRIATPVLFPSAETLPIMPLSASAPSVQFTEIKWTAFSSKSNKLAIFARQPGQDKGGSLCVYQIINDQTFALEQLWGTTTDHEVYSLALSPDGKLLVVVLDGIFIVWIDASNGNFLHIFRATRRISIQT
jgi:WD40 repeat protein